MRIVEWLIDKVVLPVIALYALVATGALITMVVVGVWKVVKLVLT